MITQEEMNKYFEEVGRHQKTADEARDSMREIIENLNMDRIIYLNAFTESLFDLQAFEPYGGDLCAAYRNYIREQIAFCDDAELLDLILKLLLKSQPQDEDVAEHHKWTINKN